MSCKQEYRDLKRLIYWVLATLLLMTVLTVITGIISHSLAIDAIAIDAGASMVLHLFSLISIGIIMRKNAYSFPYGTGKLENFSAFLYALIIIIGALFIIISAVKRFLNPPASINIGLAQVLLLIWVLRDIPLFLYAIGIKRRYSEYSLMTHSYLINLKITIISDISLLAGLLIGFWMYSIGLIRLAIVIDLSIAVFVAFYMLYNGYSLIVSNFQSLIDMPLPENDQYKILNALVEDIETYKGIGNIYSQLSGNTRMIQIEIYVDNSMTAEEIDQLRYRIEERLQKHFHNMLFHLIPLVENR